ncbi:MAG: tRNA (N6-threonylcarbamoyladenosine(37)-N6)-methyltransferase TrmO [Huintestinicola sp.]|uniref:tRNA (N6-threonylcarbamoyladenosine(37)-N6)-methyltransferase TrmO n=1 Tax=Huintestinicola sp. TaxID=2981661 RepID=UPI003F0202B4
MKTDSGLKIIARIENDFTEKFGVPRQSGLADIGSKIVFEPEYRVPEAFRGLEGFTHIWLLWQFSEAVREKWSPTVRPPRLGGNTRMGVFATRSPFRPNSIGLSSVRLDRIELHTPLGPVLYVSGADLMNGTPIIDIKPYLAYTDSHPDASGGFALTEREGRLKVEIPESIAQQIPEDKLPGLSEVLSQDPRPQYHSPDRIYTMSFGGFEISFKTDDRVLTVTDIRKS